MTHPAGYLAIGGGFSYAPLRVGLVLRNIEGREVYFQPGDDETAIRAEIEALGEASENLPEAKHGIICDMCLGEYFHG